MAATATENGVYIVTQYIPAANPNPAQSGTPKNEAPPFLRAFKKGQPKSLGIVQIMIGLFCFMVGIILRTNSFPPVNSTVGWPFVCALVFFISGGLSVSAERKGKRRLVKGGLVMNILSAIVSGTGIILCFCDLVGGYLYTIYDYEDCRDHYNSCFRYQADFASTQTGILAVLLLLLMLEFCIALATSCFGCKSVRMPTSQQIAQPLFIAQNNYTQDPRVLPMQATGVPLAHGVMLREDIPMSFGVCPIPGLPKTQDEIREMPTAPPPSYYRDIPGDFQHLNERC